MHNSGSFLLGNQSSFPRFLVSQGIGLGEIGVDMVIRRGETVARLLVAMVGLLHVLRDFESQTLAVVSGLP